MCLVDGKGFALNAHALRTVCALVSAKTTRVLESQIPNSRYWHSLKPK